MSLNLEVQILGQYKNLTKATRGAAGELNKLKSTTQGISRSISRTLGAIGVGLSFVALKNGIASVVNEASNLEQGIGAAQSVFKGFADGVVEESKRAASAFGLSSVQYLQSANLIGAQLSNLGFTQQEYTDKSQDLVALGADLAATFGGTTLNAVQALSAVFRGEYNQVEKYGVALRKSDITARVAKNGFKNLTGEALKQQEALAALEILYGQTASAQGQFARETNTFAGSMQILKANLDNAKVSLGEGFTPALVGLGTWITDNIGVINGLTEAIGVKLAAAFASTGGAAETFGAKIILAITDLTEFLNGTADADNTFVKISESLGPVIEILGAFGELAKGVIAVLNGVFEGLFGWLRIIPGVDGSLGGLALVVDSVGKFLQTFGEKLGYVASFLIPFTAGFKIAGKVLGVFSRTAGKIVEFFKGVGGRISGFFGNATKRTNDVTKALDKYDAVMVKAGGRRSPLDPIVSQAGKAEDAIDAATRKTRLWDDASVKVKGTYDKYLPQLKKVDAAVGAIRSGVAGLPSQKTIDIKLNINGSDRRLYNLAPEAGPDRNAMAMEYGKALQESLNKVVEVETSPQATGLSVFQERIQVLIDTLQKTLTAAKNRIKDAANNFRDTVSLSFGIITNGSFAVFDVNRVIRQMQRLKDSAKNFAKDIKKLQNQGADASLIDQLLGMDALEGSATASGLLASGRLDEFMALRKDLSSIGAGAGGVANFGINGTGTGGLQSAIDGLTTTLNRGYGNTYNISVANANNLSPQQIVAAIKKYEKTNGRKVFS
tara:strand:- start:5703 stop:8039 length:2337 start_codon:yes stop_codon:yes gene_type:complete